MDCCNYMQYRNSYYNSQYYENCSYPGGGGVGGFGVGFGGGIVGGSCDYYAQRYPDFYVNNNNNNNTSCYGMQPWPTSAAHFSGK